MKLALFILGVLFAAWCHAAPPAVISCYHATVERVVDGDTVNLAVDLGLSVTTFISLRMEDVMAPELRDKGGPEAKAALAKMLPEKAKVIVQPKARANGEPVRSFVRYVGRLWLPDGTDVCEAMRAKVNP